MRKKERGGAADTDVSLAGLYFNLADILLLSLDTEGRIKDINSRGLEILGYQRDELAGRDWFDTCLPEDDRDRVRSIFESIVAGKVESHEREDGRIVCRDGRIRTMLWKNIVLKDGDGRITGTLSSGEDITDRIIAKDALQASEEMLKAVFDSTSDTMALVDRDMVLLMVNESAAARFKQKPEEMTGRNISEYLQGRTGEAMMSRFREVLATGKIVDFEDSLDNKYYYTRVYPIFAESGDVRWFAISSQDITYRKRIEQELLKTQKIESIGLLAGGIAHDYNNLLTVIMSNISLAMSGMEEGSGIYSALEDAAEASKKARDLTRQLLTLGRDRIPEKRICRIEEIITESVSLALRGSRIRPEYDIPDDIWNVYVDGDQMNQVFSHLTINAKQAMSSGGSIRVSARNLTVKDGRELDIEPGRYVEIRFGDEGIGIPHQYISRVFDPYFSTKQEGSGLGLAMAYSIMMQHGGRIRLESELGRGTEFQLYLPASDKELNEEPAAGDELTRLEGRVLVMDDQAEIRKVAGRILDHLGLTSEFVSEGEEAVAKYREAMDSGEPFDIVIMDLTIPGGLGGKEALSQLLEVDPQAKVVVSSGYSSDPIISEYSSYGFSGVIAKPYTVKSFSDVIRSILVPADGPAPE